MGLDVVLTRRVNVFGDPFIKKASMMLNDFYKDGDKWQTVIPSKVDYITYTERYGHWNGWWLKDYLENRFNTEQSEFYVSVSGLKAILEDIKVMKGPSAWRTKEWKEEQARTILMLEEALSAANDGYDCDFWFSMSW